MSAGGEALAEAVRATLGLFLDDAPSLEGMTVEQGDYPWSTNGELIGIVVDGQRYTLTLVEIAEAEGQG